MNKGQAKRRKDKSLMPEPSQKQRKKARIKKNPRDSMMGMGEVMMLLSALTMRVVDWEKPLQYDKKWQE
jgi:hypothetical protein